MRKTLPEHNVALALVHRDGRWLVARRLQNAHLSGLWEFPGGKCEPGETPEQAVLRELQEECGVSARVRRALPSFVHEYADRIVHLTPILCDWVSGEGEPLASEQCRWVTLRELRKLDMPAANAEVLRELMLYA